MRRRTLLSGAHTRFALPRGFAPDGIAVLGPFAYVGSRATGGIYRADLETGAGEIIHAGPGTPACGLRIDGRGRALLAAGGEIRVVSTDTGRLLAAHRVAGFVNDVALTRDAAWFTDSFSATLYKLPLTGDGTLRALRLTGIAITAGTVNLNGICATPDGRALLVVQSNTGLLFRVDPGGGDATPVDLGGVPVTGGDGLHVAGHTLYVARNRAGTVEVFTLNRGGTAGTVIATVADPGFAVPTAVARRGDRLWVVNGKLTTPIGPEVPYDVVSVRDPVQLSS